MVSAEPLESRLIERFLNTLRGLPEVDAQLEPKGPADAGADRGIDAQVDLRVPGKAVTLLIEAKKALYPRDVRQVLWERKDFSRKYFTEHDAVLLLLADSISPGAKELLRNERVGYYDSGGSLFLPAKGIYLYIDKPPPKSLSRSMRSLFSGRRAQVLHALLIRQDEWVGVKPLAEQAQVSPATVSQVLTELERFDWIASRGQGPNKERHLREPSALLDAWVSQLETTRPPTMRRYYVPSMRAEELVQKLGRLFAAHDIEYAITHEAAGQLYSPFLSSVSQVRCRALIGPAFNQAIGELDARVVNEGANLAVIEAKSSGELLFRKEMGGVWLASPVQVYLDLMRSEGRAKEMAERLRRERIGF